MASRAMQRNYDVLTVSEGSVVALDAGRFMNGIDPGSKFEWEQEGERTIDLFDAGAQKAWFIAPYLKGSDETSRMLEFSVKWTAKGRQAESAAKVKVKVKRVQRALVLQGGGGLGAYEAGAFEALYEKLREEDRRKGREGRQLFDIVAGTSIGAINAAVLVSHVLARQRNGASLDPSDMWRESDGRIKNFWKDVSSYSPVDMAMLNPFFEIWWEWFWDGGSKLRDSWAEFAGWMLKSQGWLRSAREKEPWNSAYFFWPDNFGPMASAEAARRYYSAYLLTLYAGTPRVLSRGIWQPDFRFLDWSKGWNRFDNMRFLETLKEEPHADKDKYWDGESIKTDFGSRQPRLIFVGVDLQDSVPVAFDSYDTKSEYGAPGFVRVINYDGGLGMEHLRTSISPFLSFTYPTLEAGEDTRAFWDGVFLSNTPLREVIHRHRDYWHKVRKEDVPDLEVYIVNVYPVIERGVPRDRDAIEDREYDILFNDKTRYDQKVAEIVGDYADLAHELVRLARQKGASDQEIEAIEQQKAGSRHRNSKKRTYRDLLEGRFSMTRVVRIENTISPEGDNDVVLGKIFDFTKKTVGQLLEKGRDDGLEQMDIVLMGDKLAAMIELAPLAAEAGPGENPLEKPLDEMGQILRSVLASLEHGQEQAVQSQLRELQKKAGSVGALLARGNSNQAKIKIKSLLDGLVKMIDLDPGLRAESKVPAVPG